MYFDMVVGFYERSQQGVLWKLNLFLILLKCRQDYSWVFKKTWLSFSMSILSEFYSGCARHHWVKRFKIISSHKLFDINCVEFGVKARVNSICHSGFKNAIPFYSEIACGRISCSSLLVSIDPITDWSIHGASFKFASL